MSAILSALEIDAIGEILNISLGSSATAISTMLSARVDITTPVVSVVAKEEFSMGRVEPAVGVEITYVKGLEGSNVMLLKRHDVKVIVEMMMGFEIPESEFVLDEMNISAICEVMNMMMGASATALSEFLGRVVDISTPVSFELKNEQEFIDKYFTDDSPWVVISFVLRIEDKLESEFFNVMPISLAKSLVRGFLPEGYDDEPEPAPAPAATAPEPAPASSSGGVMSQEEIEKLLSGGTVTEEPAPAPAPASSSGGVLSQEEIEKLLSGGAAEAAPAPAPVQPAPAPAQPVAPAAPVPAAPPVQPVAAAPVAAPAASSEMAQMMQMQMQMMQQMMQQMMASQSKPAKEPPQPKTINVKSSVQPSLSQDSVEDGEQEENMEMIKSVPLEISVESGRTQKLGKDIREFTKGSLVVLDKLAGEQVDLLVNGRCIARGDVVVVEDNFGIRITEILKPNILGLENL